MENSSGAVPSLERSHQNQQSFGVDNIQGMGSIGMSANMTSGMNSQNQSTII